MPLALILLTIAGLAGLALWFSLAPPAPTAPPPAVRISLAAPVSKPPADAKPDPGAPASPAVDQPSPTPAEAAAPRKPDLAVAVEAARPPRSDPVPAARKLPSAEAGAALREAPDPGLIEPSRHGPLPIVGRDGREAWRVYARPFDKAEKRPRISVVLYGLGLDATATRSAIKNLPTAISLAFTPYAKGLDGWLAEARAAGHEALMMVPMESADFPISDPGPRALLTSLSAEQNIDRLEWVLARAAGYVGITEHLGSRFTASSHHMLALFQALRKRGLLFLAGRREAAGLVREIAGPLRLPFAVSKLYIDLRATRSLIDAQLVELERLAGNLGQSVGMGFPYPITIERLANWAGKLESRGFVLAPVSALAKREGS